LTTKIKNISREPGPNTKSGTRFYRNCFFLRCSRPLCSSQPTTPTHPHTPTNTVRAACAGKNQKQPNPTPPEPHPQQTTPGPQPEQNKALLSQDPTVCQTITHQHPTPRFPETHPGTPSQENQDTQRTHTPSDTSRHLSIDIPPMSTHRGTNARAMG
jgi:outer membrane biosynthesis protein TonB